MAVRLPGPVVLLTGEDCAALNGPLGQLLSALAQRDGQVPRRLVEIREEVRRAAVQFRVNALADADSGTVFDAPGSRSGVSGATERLTAAEAARLTGVSREMICRLAVAGALKGAKTGRRGSWVLDADSVAMWQAGRRERPEAA